MAPSAFAANLRNLRDLFDGGTVVGLSDGELLVRYAASNDGPAFEALVARHGPMVVATCRAILKNDHDVEDAFQATFLVLARKARSVRGGGALGGWLHRVAYRIAVEAKLAANRRRRRESEETVMNIPDRARAVLDFDVRSILHAEIDRLREAERLPVVLCDLEGLTYEQAASHLHWTVSTLCHRLAKARKRLRDRLSRRGVTAEALGVAVAGSRASATFPSSWAHAAVAAAAGGTTSAAVSALAQTIVMGMLMTKLKIAATIALAAAAIISAGVVAIGAGRTNEPRRGVTPPAAATDKNQALELPPMAPIEIRGRVVGPDGKPVAGATVKMARFDDLDDRANPQTTSDREGRFFLRVGRASRNSVMLNGQDIFPWVIASATGFGPGKVEGAFKAAASGDLTIRLANPGPPIEGRVVDLEGQPVAGAQIRATRLFCSPQGDLAAWLAQARDRGVRSPEDGLDTVPVTIATTTDRDGRFRVSGLGRERIVELVISAPTIASTQVYAMNRDGAEFRAIDRQSMKTTLLVIHARTFASAVAPSKPIEGVIRDKDSGRPVAGLTLRAAIYDPQSFGPGQGIEATTDVQGRYRLNGLPKAAAYRILVEQAAEKRYSRATFRVTANSPAFEPVNFDFSLKRGVLIRGRITDKATGEPVPGYIHAFTSGANPAIKSFPGFAVNDIAYVFVKDDGHYDVVGLPGRNIIACRSEVRRFRGHVGAERLAGYDPKQMALYDTLPLTCYFRNYHVLAEIDVDAKAETATLDLQVDPGRSVTLKVLDPEGKPIGGTKASGVSDLFSSAIVYEQASPMVEIHGLDPSNPRRVIVTHEGRRLIGSVYLRGDEMGPLTVKLQPWGIISGRVIDDDGSPRGGLTLGSAGGSFPERPDVQGVLPDSDFGGIRIGSDGRFRVERLVPGLKYGASTSERGMGIGELFHDVIVAPGEVKDLGDLKVVPYKP